MAKAKVLTGRFTKKVTEQLDKVNEKGGYIKEFLLADLLRDNPNQYKHLLQPIRVNGFVSYIQKNWNKAKVDALLKHLEKTYPEFKDSLEFRKGFTIDMECTRPSIYTTGKEPVYFEVSIRSGNEINIEKVGKLSKIIDGTYFLQKYRSFLLVNNFEMRWGNYSGIGFSLSFETGTLPPSEQTPKHIPNVFVRVFFWDVYLCLKHDFKLTTQ